MFGADFVHLKIIKTHTQSKKTNKQNLVQELYETSMQTLLIMQQSYMGSTQVLNFI